MVNFSEIGNYDNPRGVLKTAGKNYENFYTMYWKNPSLALLRHLEMRLIIDELNTMNIQRPFIDIGCGNGSFSSLLGIRFDLGIDISENQIQRAKTIGNHDRLIYGGLEQIGDSKINFVLVNSVIEHVNDFINFLSNIYRILKSGGIVIITIPLESSIKSIHTRFSGGEDFIGINRDFLEHFNIFSIEEWKNIFAQIGFGIIKERTYLSKSLADYISINSYFNFKLNPRLEGLSLDVIKIMQDTLATNNFIMNNMLISELENGENNQAVLFILTK